MNDADSRLQRLLKTAGQANSDEPVSVPFGFDTRVVALWRSGNGNAFPYGIVRLVRRVAVLAALVILVSGGAAFYEFSEARDIVEPGANDYAIADSAIQTEFDQ